MEPYKLTNLMLSQSRKYINFYKQIKETETQKPNNNAPQKW